MSEFNKALYWERRKEGKRGQGDTLRPVAVPFGLRPKRVSKKARRLT